MQNLKYVKIPINPMTVKQKLFAGLTKRQLVSFLIGGACGVIPFFIAKNLFGIIGGVVALFLFAAPVVFCALYERNGIYFNRQIKMMWEFYFNRKKPRKRLFKSHNSAEYAELMNERIKLMRRLRNA